MGANFAANHRAGDVRKSPGLDRTGPDRPQPIENLGFFDFGGFWGPASWVGIHSEIVDFGGFWGPASWVGIPFEIVDFLGGFGAQLAGSESLSKSLICWGVLGPS